MTLHTMGDLLLLLQTYKEKGDKYPHEVQLRVTPEVFTTVNLLVKKINVHTARKISRREVLSTLVAFSLDALQLSNLAEATEPLCALPEDSIAKRNIAALKEVSDIVNLSPADLTKVDRILNPEGIIWKHD